ncbi:MAG TPA: arylesterase [Rhodocyclaceae bacterium]|nr:arylesterase [Rhodocyclaceae bacterium]
MSGSERGYRFLQRLAGALLLAVALLGAACSGPKEAPLPRQAVVLVLGDSISAGHGLSREQSWVAGLAPLTGWQLINGGVSGDTTQQGRARLPALLEAHQPAAVIIELGGNDMLRRRSTRETVATLDALIAEVRAAGARPVLMAIPAPSVAGAAFGSLSDAGFYAEIAERQKVPLIDEVVADVLSTPEYKLDQLHPNAEGHRELASRVADKLRRLGLLAGR